MAKDLGEGLDPESGDASSTTFADNMRLPVHRWFRYSAGFSAAWAQSVIAEASRLKPARVLDPFAGSATTLIAAEDAGALSCGFESHPFVSRVARAKLARRTDPHAYLEWAQAIVRDLAIKAPDIDIPVGKLSGGNQQKVLIGRWLRSRPRVLILDEPTRGVDVGARSEIHRLLRELAEGGMAVLVISSEPEELPDLCDRVLVMAEGRIVNDLSGGDLTRSAIVAASYGAAEQRAQA